ncbi:serine/arginine repetitive matrix protein 2 [Angomonas deanei]|uniref:Uncharacterized protein n=1 Tax=Angomonas deanei TaxID=59799 RepID=A0A7G2C6M9_9TRYP|nr:serine/arginine repetitive matrix protein 2 [Angomonas deanei]CAD2213612.1 hypothetical protein, conserved [Angomonas deanei]|eukprot:EPY15715.1 serine/arginine repetitive matrix protein 2 [Angomonas deanei]
MSHSNSAKRSGSSRQLKRSNSNRSSNSQRSHHSSAKRNGSSRELKRTNSNRSTDSQRSHTSRRSADAKHRSHSKSRERRQHSQKRHSSKRKDSMKRHNSRGGGHSSFHRNDSMGPTDSFSRRDSLSSMDAGMESHHLRRSGSNRSCASYDRMGDREHLPQDAGFLFSVPSTLECTGSILSRKSSGTRGGRHSDSPNFMEPPLSRTGSFGDIDRCSSLYGMGSVYLSTHGSDLGMMESIRESLYGMMNAEDSSAKDDMLLQRESGSMTNIKADKRCVRKRSFHEIPTLHSNNLQIERLLGDSPGEAPATEEPQKRLSDAGQGKPKKEDSRSVATYPPSSDPAKSTVKKDTAEHTRRPRSTKTTTIPRKAEEEDTKHVPKPPESPVARPEDMFLEVPTPTKAPASPAVSPTKPAKTQTPAPTEESKKKEATVPLEVVKAVPAVEPKPVVPSKREEEKVQPEKQKPTPSADRTITKKYTPTVHTVVVNNSKSLKVSARDGTVTLEGKEYKVSETQTNNCPFDLSKSDYLTHLTEEVHAGRMVSVVSLCGDNNRANVEVTEQVAIEMATNIIQRLEAAAKANHEQYQAHFIGAAFPTTNRTDDEMLVRDVQGSGEPMPALFATNPITAVTLAGMVRTTAKVSTDVAPIIQSCVKAFDTTKDEMLVIQMHITQVRAPGDVYATSLLFAFVNHMQKTFVLEDVMRNITERKKEGVLLFPVLCGACSTALLVPLSYADTKNMQQLRTTVEAGENFDKMAMLPPRSGSIQRFARKSQEALESGLITDRKRKERIRKMMWAAEKALRRPETWNPAVIPLV